LQRFIATSTFVLSTGNRCQGKCLAQVSDSSLLSRFPAGCRSRGVGEHSCVRIER